MFLSTLLKKLHFNTKQGNTAMRLRYSAKTKCDAIVSPGELLNISKKFKPSHQYQRDYAAHPHDMVHIPAKFGGNTAMHYMSLVGKRNVWRTFRYLPSRAFGAAGDKRLLHSLSNWLQSAKIII